MTLHDHVGGLAFTATEARCVCGASWWLDRNRGWQVRSTGRAMATSSATTTATPTSKGDAG